MDAGRAGDADVDVDGPVRAGRGRVDGQARAPAIAWHASAHARQALAHSFIIVSLPMDMHASAHLLATFAHIAAISIAIGDWRIIMSAHIRVMSEQSMSGAIIAVSAC
ncbi:hypothetical protein [Streptosporangium sp. NPDC006930]|uniref:hypothetical protein n=1 Tax=unclassified Streptosporangium TaxID=2632669 RepID=UPI00343C49B1